MQMCCEMVIKLHKKGGQASEKTPDIIAGKPIYEHF